MHEYSIVQSLIQSCEEHVKENDASKVTKLFAKIGVMSGVEPYLLEEAFELFKEGSVCDGCEFNMHIQKVKIECRECNTTSELEKNEYTCPKCQGIDIKIIDGEDMFLMSLELE
ncbi:MAG: hydrogenase maturation nickel metallochaperone HypA [Campylobacterota bacterium]|nr:hydrogenase maturation nickel metallochaperone HypA [Campylobacterota bacterium]